MKVVEYDPSRRAQVAELMGRVWGSAPAERELAWFYEENPVRPASVLLAEDDGRTVATVAIAFVRMTVAGEELQVGMPLRVATDPAYRGRGIFGRLQAENEERVRGLGVRLLLTVPNAASTPVFVNRLGWRELPGLRVWVAPRLGQRRSRLQVERIEQVSEPGGGSDHVLRDAAWINWRFAEAPSAYRLLMGDGYAVTGRRGRLGVVACAEGSGVVREARRSSDGGRFVLASPPPARRASYLRCGFLPSRRRFTVLGKALAEGQVVPARPHFELGDLDFL